MHITTFIIGTTILFFVVIGVAFTIIGTIGVMRFRGFWTRLHAACLVDTLGIQSIFIANILYNGIALTSIKLFTISILIFLSSPSIVYTIANTAWHMGARPHVIKGIQEINATNINDI